MRQTHTPNAAEAAAPTYITVEHRLPEGTYTSGVHRATPPEPHDCPSCGSLATDPNPAQLIDGIYLDCPRCPSQALSEDVRTPDQQLTADVRDILAEEASRGSGRPSSSSGGGQRKKRAGRLDVRFEQEVALYDNGHSAERVQVQRLETASERFELRLTLDCRERLREVASEKRNEYGEPYPQVQLIRDALRKIQQLENPREIERGTPKDEIQLRLYPAELLIIDAAADYWEMSRHQVVEACLWAHLGRSVQEKT